MKILRSILRNILMMKNPYKAQSTLDIDFPIYAKRNADKKIIEYLEEDYLCYILTPRKFGKSSLLMRALKELTKKYVCIYLELPSIDEEQGDHKEDWDDIKQVKNIKRFYQIFLDRLITRLECELKTFGLDLGFSSIEEWNQKFSDSEPERFFSHVSKKFINQIKIIVFIDEIDVFKSFPFSTDNFFRQIRGLLNDKTRPNIFNFCFVGVAKVSDLIANPEITSFNLGKKIELTGFKLTQDNQVPENLKVLITNELKSKCENPEKVIEIVIKRTGGQPFLTQKFLSLIIDHVEEKISENKEYECLLNLEREYMITNWKQNDDPEHFTTIERRIIMPKVVNGKKTNELKNYNETGQRLKMYRDILLTEEVRADNLLGQDKETMDDLILSGLVFVNNQGFLQAYCPIYERIFHREWIDNWLDCLDKIKLLGIGYWEKLGKWLITQNEECLLSGGELEFIISHLPNQQLSDEEHKFLVKSQIRTSNSDSEFLEQRLVKLAIDIHKNKKAINPQMMIKKILEQIKPKYVKCIDIICNLLDQHNNFINEGEEEKIINEVVEEFSDRWQENEEGQHLQEIRDKIINHERSLYLLLLYQQILTENDQVNPTYINSNDLEYLIGLDLVVSEEELKVSNKLYKEVFDSSFVTQEIKNKINSLVKSQWQFNNELKEETKQEVTDLITKTSILLPLSTKTNNLERLISLILEWSQPDHTLLKLLVNSITESQGRILLNDNNQEARKSFNNFVRMHVTDNWQENPSRESFNYFKSLQNKLLNNKNCDVFWLLLTYFYALKGSKNGLIFNQEVEELSALKFILNNQIHENKQLKIANNIYQEILNENWVLTQLTHLQKPNRQNLIAWLNSERSEKDNIIITNKFPNNYKQIFEEIISWTRENQTLTTKIIRFIEVGIVEVNSEDLNWFNQNIMYSPNLGNFVDENEFKLLIGNRISQLGWVENTNQLHQNMLRLTKKFKRNPLIIVNKVLENTEGELNSKIINIIDLILSNQLPNQYLIDTEADVKKISELLNLDTTIKTQPSKPKPSKPKPSNIVKSPIMPKQKTIDQPENSDSIDDVLKDIIDQSYIKAIILVNLKEGEVVDHRYNFVSEAEPLYERLIGKGSGGVAVEDFDTLIPTIEAFQKFAEATKAGELEYSIYTFTERLVIGAFLEIGGNYYGVFYIGKSGVSRGKLVNLCERTFPNIKTAFENDPDFN